MAGKRLTTAVILAGGAGERMGLGKPKQYLEIGGKTVLNRCIEIFEKNKHINEIVLVVPEGHVEYCKEELVKPFGYKKVSKVVTGGASRRESSYKGVLSSAEGQDYVLIHDGARPFVSEDEINRLMEAVFEHNAAILAAQVKETIKRAEAGVITETVDRAQLWAAQTPQGFGRKLIISAHEFAEKEKFQATDDASLVENMNLPVQIVEGSYNNIKITTKEDLVFAEAILRAEGV